MKTELKDRVLWFDGTSEVTAELVPSLFLLGVSPDKIVVHDQDDDILIFNELSDTQIPTSKLKNNKLDLTWNIPAEYISLDLNDHLTKCIIKKQLSHSTTYVNRLNAELMEIKLRGMENLLKALIYITDTFKQTGQVWGVGRGSSCASLILFLIGLHQVDPVKYNIPLNEFFHD